MTQHNPKNHQGFSVGDKTLRSLGSIYTPSDLADYLTSWAIQEPTCKVLDLGVGDGIFVLSAYRRLLNLGTLKEKARFQIYGAEKYTPAFKNFLELSDDIGIEFPYVYSGDFFDIEFPQVEAIIGNPPYVRRMYLDSIDYLRESVSQYRTSDHDLRLSRLTDLYIYFLLRACNFLKPAGKLAVVVADSWLNVGYGQEFKKYLKTFYYIERLISFDQRFFEADVKPVLLLATKRSDANNNDKNKSVNFIRVGNGNLIDILKQPMESLNKQKNVIVSSPKQVDLNINDPWSIYFRAPELYNFIASHDLMTPFSRQAQTRLGIQTLAKEFFVLSPYEAALLEIEPEFLAPLAHSSKTTKEPIIEIESEPTYYLFYCSKDKTDLKGTKALDYILQGETREVLVRGKNKTVIGYQNKTRIQEDGRPHWYDLKSKVERRGIGNILIPRLVYQSFSVIWNKAEFIPGELFIEFVVPSESLFEIEVYLAILSSSITEVILRSQAQIYGGGTFNISPGQIKNAPILNVRKLTKLQKQQLSKAYYEYLDNTYPDNSELDKIIYKILGFDTILQSRLKNLVKDMHLIATSTHK